LHGRMKPKEKEEIMKSFVSGKKMILVATSVVEVGVDVPEATVMWIEGAERFGLAQLHQFRGRVGRSDRQSYCFLFSTDGDATHRLRAMINTNDGFKLAEIDLKLRGPGEVFGLRQSGIPDLKMASYTDARLVKMTRVAAEKVLKEDLELAKYHGLGQKLINVEE
ncbi:MAG: helicase-related protein, partial [Patescibacteria group bacterium]|nr:helicase-related protein [Patescibacteria group bacterium]